MVNRPVRFGVAKGSLFNRGGWAVHSGENSDISEFTIWSAWTARPTGDAGGKCQTPQRVWIDKGVVTKWERLRRKNHWFDALCIACAAGNYCGVRLVEETPPPQPRRTLAQMSEDSARQRIDLERWNEMRARWGMAR